jgi:hypothetical protein
MVTFELEAFATVVREPLQLLADFSMTINAEMKVGRML